MSRIRPEYEDKKGFQFSRWLDGTEDPYLGRMEIKPKKQEEKKGNVREGRNLQKNKRAVHLFLMDSLNFS